MKKTGQLMGDVALFLVPALLGGLMLSANYEKRVKRNQQETAVHATLQDKQPVKPGAGYTERPGDDD